MKNSIVPFGKYKGQPIEAMQADHQYVEWLTQQDWFKSRYSQINNIIINNFNQPSETPEHNKLVALFTDKLFQYAFVLASHNITEDGVKDVDLENSYTNTFFESNSGNDVLIYYKIKRISGETGLPSNGNYEAELQIECKPHISDDFPAVLRQCRSQRTQVVLYQSMKSATVENNDICKIFGGIKLVSLEKVYKYKSILESL